MGRLRHSRIIGFDPERMASLHHGISESWVQDVADSLRLAPLSPQVSHALIPAVELQLRRLIQQAHKFQRRSKSSVLKVEDLNLALRANQIEPIYGLHLSETLSDPLGLKGSGRDKEKDKTPKGGNLVAIGEFSSRTIPPYPIKPQIALHWLAVNGAQPTIPENPHIVVADPMETLPSTIEKELQLLYARMTSILASAQDTKSVTAVYHVLSTDPGIQDLVPFLSRFFYAQIKENTKKLVVTRVMVRGIKALHANPSIILDAHLSQLLPAIFTCIVGAKLCQSADEDHWTLRDSAAALIAEIAEKYHAKFPDLLGRICKTYTDAMTPDKALTTVYGGIVGLRALGHHLVKTVLLDQLDVLATQLVVPVSPTQLKDTKAVTWTTVSSQIAEEEDAQGGMESEEMDFARGRPTQKRVSVQPWRAEEVKESTDSAMEMDDGAPPPPPSPPMGADDGHLMPPPPAPPAPAAAKPTTTHISAPTSSMGTTPSAQEARKMMLKDLEQRFAREMCREALRVALGKYMVESIRTPDLPWISSKQRPRPPVQRRRNLNDLEEALVPFYSSASHGMEGAGCRLWL